MDNTRVIKIFEDRQEKIDLNQQEIKDLLLMKEIIGRNRVILQADGSLLIRHYVGFVQVNKTRLLIYPKISSKSLGESEYKRSFNILMKLLSYSGFKSVKKLITPQNMDKYEGDILESFIGIFIDELLLQFKRDINRGYNNKLENQGFIKGKIDFAKTIKKNSFKKHLHYIKYDDFSENILLNKIFKSIVHNLIITTNSKDNKLKLRQSLLWLEDVDKLILDNEIWDRINFTRQNRNYKAAFNMAKLFYYNSSPNLNKGDEYTFSFLVPVNQLFEFYLYEILNSNTRERYDIKYQNSKSYLAHIDGKQHSLLKPDITLTLEGEIGYILDAKYKELILKEQTSKISQADIYQMLAYSVGYQCNNIALIYPKFLSDNPSEPIVKELIIQNYDNTISIKLIKVDLEIEPDILENQLMGILINNE